MTNTAITPITGAVIPPGNKRKGGTGDERDWLELERSEWDSNSNAYRMAQAAMRIVARLDLTFAAFAAECGQRGIRGWGSQGAVSRRIRWASLHDDLWQAKILPPGVFLPESATRPLFDRSLKLTRADQLRLIADLFGPDMTPEQLADLAAQISEAMMREHLAKNATTGKSYKAPRRLNWRRAIAQALEDGVTADEITTYTHATADSARNATKGRAA